MKNKSIQFPDKLTIALARYFLNYQLHQKQNIGSNSKMVAGKLVTTEHYRDGRPWDKQADVDNVWAVLRKLGYGGEAIAGTFWIRNKSGKTYEISQDTWPLALSRVPKSN